MTYSFDEPAERDRRRWMRESAHLYIRPDAYRFMRPDAPGRRHPDERLWNVHAAHYRRAAASPPDSSRSRAAELASLQAQQDALGDSNARKDGLAQKCAQERAESERLKRRSDAAWDRFVGAFDRNWEACCKAEFNPAQPRVPAGNPGGGQWTDEGEDAGAAGSGGAANKPINRVRLADSGGLINPDVLSDAAPEWISGEQYAQNDPPKLKRDRAEGHHYVPQAISKGRDIPDETRRVFDEAKTGRLHVVGNRWDGPHRTYNKAVDEMLARFLDANGIKEHQLTPDHARSFLKEVMETRDPRIRNFNMGIRFREFLYQLRTGIRRNE